MEYLLKRLGKVVFPLKGLFFCSLCVLSFILFSDCGLETFYYLEAPLTDGHTTRYNSSDRTQFYFSFLTNEEGDNGSFGDSDFTFQGTEVYYKIYNNYSTMSTVQSAIDSLNSSSDVSAAATSLISTRNYKTLTLSPTSYTPLVPEAGDNRYVYIRLNSVDSESEFASVVCVGSASMDTYDGSTAFWGYPRRSFNSSYGFDFNNDDDYNPVPKSDDEDVTWSSSTSEDGVWYIDMWAVSLGRDSSYSPSYSKLLHLGSISIAEEWYDE